MHICSEFNFVYCNERIANEKISMFFAIIINNIRAPYFCYRIRYSYIMVSIQSPLRGNQKNFYFLPLTNMTFEPHESLSSSLEAKYNESPLVNES